MMAELPDQDPWRLGAERLGVVLDGSLGAVGAIVMGLFGAMGGTVRAATRVVRWIHQNREQLKRIGQRLVGPALFLGAVGAGATAGAVTERALLRSRSHEPFAGAPTPYGQPSLIDGPAGRIYLHRHGSATLPVVILVHGWTNTHAIWHKQVRQLRDQFHVVTYDQPGHGTSDAPTQWSIESLGAALRAVIESVDRDRVTLVGHSLGGVPILDLFQRDPGFCAERVAGVVLVGSAASFTDRPMEAGLVARLERRLRPGGRLIELREVPLIAALSRRSSDVSHLAFRLVAFGRRPDPADIDLTEQQWMDADPNMIRGVARALTTWDGRGAGERLPVNTAVICGSRDRVLPPWLSREIADIVGTDDLELVPGRGHQLHLEAPDEVSDCIARIAKKGAADGAGG